MRTIIVVEKKENASSLANEVKQNTINHLIAQVLDGNSNAFEPLWNTFSESLMFHAVRPRAFGDEELAKELLQEICIKAFINLQRFDHTKANFSTWLFRLTINHITDFYRRKKLDSFRMTDQILQDGGEEGFSSEDALFKYRKNSADQYETPYSTMERTELKMALTKLMSQFKPDVKKVLELYFYEDLPYEQISQEMNMPLGTIKAVIHRGKQTLQQKAKSGNYLHFFIEC